MGLRGVIHTWRRQRKTDEKKDLKNVILFFGWEMGWRTKAWEIIRLQFGGY